MKKVKKLIKNFKEFKKKSRQEKIKFFWQSAEFVLMISMFLTIVFWDMVSKIPYPSKFVFNLILGFGANRFIHYYISGLTKVDHKRGFIEGLHEGMEVSSKQYQAMINTLQAQITKLQMSIFQEPKNIAQEEQPLSNGEILKGFLEGGEINE